MSSSQPIICVPKQTHRVFFFAELTEFAAALSKFSPPKQCSRNGIPPVSENDATQNPLRGPLGGAVFVVRSLDLQKPWPSTERKAKIREQKKKAKK